MRLTRPSFGALGGVGSDPCPASPHLSSTALAAAVAHNSGVASLASPLAGALLLPQNFENIYLGETFTAYVCVHNEGTTPVTDVSVKVEESPIHRLGQCWFKADLQTSSQRVSLPSEYAEGVPELDAGGSLGQILTYEVNHQGQHMCRIRLLFYYQEPSIHSLVCAVQYTPAFGEKLYFRKFFKFPVAKPLDVRTKFYNAESEEVYLEAQVQNITTLPMVMERVSLEPAELYTSEPINSIPDASGNDVSVFDGFSYLNPQDTRQYLYRLAPKPGLPPKSFRGVSSIGKVDMVWRTGLGERGRLQTSPLQRMAPGTGDLRLSIHSAPSKVRLNEGFMVVCNLLNASERALELWMELEETQTPQLVWTTRGHRSLGLLAPSATLQLPLNLISVVAGLHWISGLRLTDTLLGRTYELDEIAQVFVQN